MGLNKIGMLFAAVLLFITIAVSAQAKQETNKSGTKVDKAATAAKTNDKNIAQAATHTVVVYYFYVEPRCVSCRNIEAFTKEAVEKVFVAELKDGRLLWMPVNLKAEGNWHFVEEFKLTSKSVVVADYKGSKPDKEKLIRSKNLEKIWELLREKPKFIEYIQAETRLYLPKEEKKADVKKGKDKKKKKDDKKK